MVLAGHSDCKAMNLVYDNRHTLNQPKSPENESVLKTWLMSNSRPQIEKYFEAEKSNFKKPLKFHSKNFYG